MRFLEDGRLPIHNKHSEPTLRREAFGRKNWIFIGIDDAGEVNACFASLPSWPARRVLELAPAFGGELSSSPRSSGDSAATFFRRARLPPASVAA